MNRLGIAMAVALMFGGAGMLLASPSATRLMEQAIQARSQGDLDGAVQTLEEAVQTAARREQKILALLMLGDCQLYAERFEQAIDTYQELINQKPASEEEAEARFRQAQAYLMLGQSEKAHDLCRDLKKRFPGTEFARLAGHLLKSVQTSAKTPAKNPGSVRTAGTPSELSVSSKKTEKSTEGTAARVGQGSVRQARDTEERGNRKPAAFEANSVRPSRVESVVAAKSQTRKPVMLTNKDLEEMNARSTGPSRPVRDEDPEAETPDSDTEAVAKPADPASASEPADSADAGDSGDSGEPVTSPASSKSSEPADSKVVAAAKPSQTKKIADSSTEKSGKFEEVEDISAALGKMSQAPSDPEPETFTRPAISTPASSRPPDSLAALLTFPKLSRQESESLATEILKDQEEMQLRSGGTPDAELLIRLAGNTARFGELKEACRLYDQLLRLHPASRFVEEAYFEAIRLRVILRAYAAAQQWGATFLKSFPKSSRREAMQKLLDHAARQSGKKGPAGGKQGAAATGPDDELSRDPHYREGNRLREEGKYALALDHFQRLTTRFAAHPRLWHELALLEIQMRLYPQAEKHVKKLLEIDPNHSEGRSLLGYIHYQRREYQKAAGDYQKAREAKKGSRPEEGLTFFDSESAARRLHQADRRKGDEP